MDLAARVAERVEIQGVLVSQVEAKRGPDTDTRDDDFDVEIKIPQLGMSKDPEKGRFWVFLTFELSGTGKGEGVDETALSIKATFVVTYSLDSFEDLSEENFRAFAELNGIFNAWPYWRELVQSTTARMGLDQVVVPVYRVSRKRAPKAEKNSLLPPTAQG